MKRTIAVAALSGAILIGTTMAASASIPDSQGMIHACVRPQNGNLTKIIDTESGQTCAANEKTLLWSQTGPQGPAGPAGAAGAAGAGQIVANANDAGPITQPAAVVGGEPFIPVLTTSFTLTRPAFVQVMAHADRITNGYVCDGSTAILGAIPLYASIDGKLSDGVILAADGATPGAQIFDASNVHWLQAGSHTLALLHQPKGCGQTAAGTVTFNELHLRGVAYQD